MSTSTYKGVKWSYIFDKLFYKKSEDIPALEINTLQVQNVSLSYKLKCGRRLNVLNNVSFDLKEGDVLGVIGSSGCGKTTLCKILENRLRIGEDQKVLYNGVNISDEYKIHSVTASCP